MRAGQLDSTITIDRRTDILDEDAARITTWVPVLKTRAQIISSDARSFLAEAGEQSETAIVFRIRYRPDIQAGDRVTLAGDEFSLVEKKEVVRRRILELRCTGSMS